MEETLPAFGGIPLVVQTFRSLGLPQSVREQVQVRERERGYDASLVPRENTACTMSLSQYFQRRGHRWYPRCMRVSKRRGKRRHAHLESPRFPPTHHFHSDP